MSRECSARSPRLARRLTSAAAACAVALGLGCGPASVPIQISFPSTETFLVTRSMRVRIYAIDATTTCASLVTAAVNGRDPEGELLFETADLSPCDVRAGRAIPDVGGALRGFLVEGLDSTGNNTILAGCSEDEVHAGARVTVALFPTSRYDAAYQADMPAAGENIEDRCRGGM
jgi:hypothetical protein